MTQNSSAKNMGDDWAQTLAKSASNSGISAPPSSERGGHDWLSFIVVLLMIVACLTAYHLIILKPTLAANQTYFVVNLDRLMEAKVMQLVEREQINSTQLSDDELLNEASAFKEQLTADLLNFSHGAPIFQPGAVVKVSDKVVDLTPIIANEYRITLSKK